MYLYYEMVPKKNTQQPKSIWITLFVSDVWEIATTVVVESRETWLVMYVLEIPQYKSKHCKLC